VCGICGVIQLGGEATEVISPEVLDRMTEVIRHRGPDDVGTYTAPGVAIGVRRLSIVDVVEGHQPFPNEDRTVWAAQTGELYEHAAIRDRLRSDGHTFASRCDTEIIPHLYESYGDHFPSQLRGMFGIVVWDEKRRRAVLARDRLGIKPLYYARAGDRLVFASELKAVLASGVVDTELDHGAIDAYLALGYFPAPLTPLRAVRKLLPGHTLVIDDGLVEEEPFWSYPVPEPTRGVSLEEHADRLLSKLDESVRLRLMSDVPLGAMLSGGLDSSLIVALMARHMSEPVKTFSVGFAGVDETNELADARLVSSTLGTEHHELELSLEDRVDLEDLCWHLDEPLADLSALGFRALSELAANHVTVALSGQGADELLAGYRKHRAAALSGAFARATAGAGPWLARLASRHTPFRGAAVASGGAHDAAERLLVSCGHLEGLDSDGGPDTPLARSSDAALSILRARLGSARADALGSALYLDAQLGLVDDMLHYFDRASMAHSLEVRVPFLDHELVELCATVPSRYKLHRFSRSKHVLKVAAQGLVPDQIIDKPKIGFFNRSVETWLRAQTDGAVADYLLDPGARVDELVGRGAVTRLIGSHSHGNGSYELLSLLMLEIWLSTFVPRAVADPARL
jgi:asparagine synthase (glutamine-hydrolysing)